MSEMGSADDEAAAATIRTFVVRPRRDRLLALLRAGRRGEVAGALAHLDALDGRRCRRIEPGQAPLTVLRAAGAPPTCLVLSEDDALDGLELPLEDALNEIVGSSLGSLVTCVPGQLAYLEGEEPGDRWVLQA